MKISPEEYHEIQRPLMAEIKALRKEYEQLEIYARNIKRIQELRGKIDEALDRVDESVSIPKDAKPVKIEDMRVGDIIWSDCFSGKEFRIVEEIEIQPRGVLVVLDRDYYCYIDEYFYTTLHSESDKIHKFFRRD